MHAQAVELRLAELVAALSMATGAYLAERSTGESFQSFAKRKTDEELIEIGTGRATAVTV